MKLHFIVNRLLFLDPPVVEVTDPAPAVKGYDATLECSETDGYPKLLTVQWKKNGQNLTREPNEPCCKCTNI